VVCNRFLCLFICEIIRIFKCDTLCWRLFAFICCGLVCYQTFLRVDLVCRLVLVWSATLSLFVELCGYFCAI